jgi:hypothetical protein
MGAWGEYDDENDRTQDVIGDLKNKVLPKTIRDLPKYIEGPCVKHTAKTCVKLRGWCGVHDTDETLRNRQKAIDWMNNNKKKIQTELNKMTDLLDSDIAGVAVAMAKGFNPMSTMPRKLPDDFPKQLRKKAYEASLRQLIQMQDGNDHGWFNPESRIKALKEQVRLFQQ